MECPCQFVCVCVCVCVCVSCVCVLVWQVPQSLLRGKKRTSPHSSQFGRVVGPLFPTNTPYYFLEAGPSIQVIPFNLGDSSVIVDFFVFVG
jgi:hypothetical protein